MTNVSCANESKATTTSHDQFIAALREGTERLCRDGLSTSDFASLIALAQIFPGVFAAAYDSEGRYLWVSDSFTKTFGLTSTPAIGRSIMERSNPEWCLERMRIIRRVLEDRMTLATIEIFQGRRLEAAFIPVGAGTATAIVLYVGRFGLALPRPTNGEAVSSHAAELLEVADWGPLSVLTRRELEVPRFVTMGRTNTEIAKHIHRTKRAVEWHIQKLYEHLNCSDRSELFKFGLTAGLHEIDDAHWDRMMERVV